MSAIKRRVIASLLAVALLVVPVLALFQPIQIEGDANGDGVVDFRDVQVVLAELQSAAGTVAADVNRDGEVDVRDLQLAFAQSTIELSGSREPLPSDASTGYIPSASPFRVFQEFTCAQLAADAGINSSYPGHTPRIATPRLISPSRTVRLLFGISPHAPPIFA
jgi:hypothetical protein